MEKTATDPALHIASLPEEVRGQMTRLDSLITAAMPEAQRTMWEGAFWGGSEQKIIGYGDYSYQRSDRETVEWFIVELAAQQNYISVYVNATDGDGYLTERYAERLGKAKIGKSSISFTSTGDIDLEALSELVARAHATMSEPRSDGG